MRLYPHSPDMMCSEIKVNKLKLTTSDPAVNTGRFTLLQHFTMEGVCSVINNEHHHPKFIDISYLFRKKKFSR